jgi:hypothetical protein
MSDRHAARLDFGHLMWPSKNAPPAAAVDVLGARMTEALEACAEFFLIADFSGQALIRLGHAASEAAGRTQGRETAERVSRFRCLWLPRSSIACCPGPTHARRASSRSQPGWNRPAMWAETRSTSPWSATRCTLVATTSDASPRSARSGRPAAPRCRRRRRGGVEERHAASAAALSASIGGGLVDRSPRVVADLPGAEPDAPDPFQPWGSHIQPPSTIHRCAVHIRLSSAASQSTSRATSSG